MQIVFYSSFIAIRHTFSITFPLFRYNTLSIGVIFKIYHPFLLFQCRVILVPSVQTHSPFLMKLPALVHCSIYFISVFWSHYNIMLCHLSLHFGHYGLPFHHLKFNSYHSEAGTCQCASNYNCFLLFPVILNSITLVYFSPIYITFNLIF